MAKRIQVDDPLAPAEEARVLAVVVVVPVRPPFAVGSRERAEADFDRRGERRLGPGDILIAGRPESL